MPRTKKPTRARMTSDLIKHWSDVAALGEAIASSAIEGIESRSLRAIYTAVVRLDLDALRQIPEKDLRAFYTEFFGENGPARK